MTTAEERAVIDAAIMWHSRAHLISLPEDQALFDAIEALNASTAGDATVWVERTWRDVRQGDIVRPVGRPENASKVNDIARHTRTTRRFAMDKMIMLESGPWETAASPFTVDVSNPDGAIEIFTTRAELAAIEACGGWSERMGVIWDA